MRMVARRHLISLSAFILTVCPFYPTLLYGFFAFHLRFFATYRIFCDWFRVILYAVTNKAKGGHGMKVKVDISPEYKEAYAVICTDKMTDEIQRMVDLFSSTEQPITALANEEDIVVLKSDEIYMVRVEDKDTIIYTDRNRYRSRKRLYEVGQQLGSKFMQISKTTLINLSYMDSIEPGFTGTLLLKLRNGCKDYVSRKYLPEFKKYLGI